MKVINLAGKQVTIELDSNEAVLISNALNEACHGIGVWEFSTRLGGSRESAQALAAKLSEAIRRL